MKKKAENDLRNLIIWLRRKDTGVYAGEEMFFFVESMGKTPQDALLKKGFKYPK